MVRPGAPWTLFPERKPVALVDIDAEGNVTRCGISRSSGTDQGDLHLCREVSKARFLPQLDHLGNPVGTSGWILLPELKP